MFNYSRLQFCEVQNKDGLTSRAILGHGRKQRQGSGQVLNCVPDLSENRYKYLPKKKANDRLHRLATLDGLTQVANRRQFNQSLQQEWQRLARVGAPLSMILCDIDYFKRYNDTYGHLAGDDCLQKVANALRKAVYRRADLLARYGGEEFAVILPNTKESEAMKVAENIREQIKLLQIPHAGSEISPWVTLSLGIATTIPTAKQVPEKLIAKADEALYQAKAQGRDRSVRFRAKV